MRRRHGARATFNGTPALVMIAGPAAGWNVTDQQSPAWRTAANNVSAEPQLMMIVLLPISLRHGSRYSGRVSLRCFFDRHRPMLTSIVKRRHGYAALCDDCGLPIERPEDGRWSSAEPLIRQTRASEQDSRMQAGRSLSRAPFPSRAASTQ